MPNDKRIFGSGKVRVGNVGATLTDGSNGVGDVQSCSLDIQYQKRDLMNSPEISNFPVLTKYYGGKVDFKLSFENLNRDVMARSTGMTSATSGGTTTLTLTKNAAPGFYRLEWEGVDVDGQPVLITIFNASAPGLGLALTLDDYGKSDITVSGYPDGSGNVCTIASAA